MKFAALGFLALNLFVGCQQAPTKVIEETANVIGSETVLVDTRSSFLFASSHIQGSVSLPSEDFIILQNPKTKRRVLDPDLTQTIERLAKKGLHPEKKIVLLGDKKSSVENKKWNWFLKQLGFEKVEMNSFEDYRKQNTMARFAEPNRAEVWDLKLSPELQDEFILKKAPDCFVSWKEKISDKKCQN